MKKRILIVEHEQFTATDIHHDLQDLGYDIVGLASTGEEAVERTVELRPDLIVMDIILGPGIDGIETAKRINATDNIPVVYLSSDISKGRMEQITSTYPLGFIIKPVRKSELHFTIEMAFYRHQMENALKESEEKYRTILESIEEAYFEIDLAGSFTFFNDALCRLAGLPRERLLGLNNLEYAEPETADKMYQTFNEIYRTGKTVNLVDYEIIRKDGIRKTIELSASIMKDSSDNPVGFRGLARDITERKLGEETLRKSEERYRTLFESNPIETIIVDKRAVITGYNDEKAKSGDRLPEPGDVMYRDYAGRHTNGMYAELMECIESGVSKEFPDARYGDKFLYIKISPFPEGAIITSIDVTESKMLEERLSHLATHDALTGLPNRALFNDRLSLELVRARRTNKKLAVMLLDLDNFKEINDSWGHTVGDEVLKIIGRRLPEFLRKSDSVARMGGDEFLILLPEIERGEDALRIGRKLLNAFKKPFVIDTRELATTTSIGFSVFPEDGDGTDMLLKNADIAMYSVKEEGRNGCRRYDPRMHKKAPLSREDAART